MIEAHRSPYPVLGIRHGDDPQHETAGRKRRLGHLLPLSMPWEVGVAIRFRQAAAAGRQGPFPGFAGFRRLTLRLADGRCDGSGVRAGRVSTSSPSFRSGTSPARGRNETPSASAKAPRSLPLRGEGKRAGSYTTQSNRPRPRTTMMAPVTLRMVFDEDRSHAWILPPNTGSSARNSTTTSGRTNITLYSTR
ncbi:hypothetical protein BMS3Abin02_00795 [bacterium BMS3Abin02]|nr:hypothetical protein BMS3Abin02_00795 [bacterium BMS3Abin02]